MDDYDSDDLWNDLNMGDRGYDEDNPTDEEWESFAEEIVEEINDGMANYRQNIIESITKEILPSAFPRKKGDK